MLDAAGRAGAAGGTTSSATSRSRPSGGSAGVGETVAETVAVAVGVAVGVAGDEETAAVGSGSPEELDEHAVSTVATSALPYPPYTAAAALYQTAPAAPMFTHTNPSAPLDFGDGELPVNDPNRGR